MSRSYKKSPVCTDQSNSNNTIVKRLASKAVRRYRGEHSNGSWYKKLYCSWNICDYRFRTTLQQAISDWETKDRVWMKQKSKREVVNNWAKFYKRK